MAETITPTEMTPEESREVYEAVHGHAPLTKQGVYDLLARQGVAFEAFEHPAVRSVEQADQMDIPFAEHGAKNFFLRDSKKRHYYLVTVPDHKKVDLRVLQERLGSKRLSFASPSDLAEKLGVWPGSVCPFAALNEESLEIPVALDADFDRWGWICCHPCDNTASVHLRTADLAHLITEHGNPFTFVEL